MSIRNFVFYYAQEIRSGYEIHNMMYRRDHVHNPIFMELRRLGIYEY